MRLPLLAFSILAACLPEARPDPCEACSGACESRYGRCELGSVPGDASALAVGPGEVFVCSNEADRAVFTALPSDGSGGTRSIGAATGSCIGVVADSGFVYWGVRAEHDSGVFRTTMAGEGLHLAVAAAQLVDFDVRAGQVAFTREGASAPFVGSLTGPAPRELRRLAQRLTQADAVRFLRNDLIVWSVAQNGEVLATRTDGGATWPLVNFPADASNAPEPAFLDAAGNTVRFVRGGSLWEVPVERAHLARAVRAVDRTTKAIATTEDGRVYVSEPDRVLGGPLAVQPIDPALGGATLAARGSVVVGARGTRVVRWLEAR